MDKNKVALVTGASRGIGQAIALMLGKMLKVTIIGTATSEAGATKITSTLEKEGINGCGVCLNVSKDESVKETIDHINNKYGTPEILVNNAGITRDNLFLRMKTDEWEDVINTNLSGMYRVTKACIKGMIKARRGRIVNISSVVASMGNQGQCNYGASKSGMEGFTASLAREVGIRNITVNCIAPGFISTDMTDKLNDANKKELLSNIPLARMGHPDDIASTVLFLVSDNAGYITGETIHVNGGMYMR